MIKVVMFATDDFSIPVFNTLYNHSEINLLQVITQPDAPYGRGRKLRAPDIKLYGIENGYTDFLQIDKLECSDLQELLNELTPDIILCISYGNYIPAYIYDKYSTVNIHPSLLPKYRGPSPIRAAIASGEKVTGITFLEIDKMMDAGNIYCSFNIDIDENENYLELKNRLAYLAADKVIDVIKNVYTNNYNLIAQDENKVLNTVKINKEDNVIDFNQSAVDIHNLIRSLSPDIGGIFKYNDINFKIFKSKPIEEFNPDDIPGKIVMANPKFGMEIACVDSRIKILEIQRPGKKKMDIKSFLAGYRFKVS